MKAKEAYSLMDNFSKLSDRVATIPDHFKDEW